MKIVCGLLLSVSIGGFIAMIVTSGFRKTFIKFLIGTPLALAIGFGIIGISEMEYKIDVEQYNNGYCECGGEWDLFDVERMRNSGSKYYYKCLECKDVIELYTRF